MGKKNKMLSGEKNSRSRKYQLTINNPSDHENCSHEALKEALQEWSGGLIYWCMCDEVGETGTPHTHLFFEVKNAIYFNSVKRAFPYAHIETAYGSAKKNRDYIRKEGKYKDTEKSETNIIETFEEYGELPDEIQARKNSSEELLSMIKDGYSNVEIYDKDPKYMLRSNNIDKIRQELVVEKYKKMRRDDLEVTYVTGATRLGKSTNIYETYGYDKVCVLSQYNKYPFDKYNFEDVIVFDEFRSQLSIEEMLSYLDCLPTQFPARYYNRQACYTKAFVISNWDFFDQYKNIQKEHPEDWDAFVARFHKIRIYTGFCKYEEYPMKDYLKNPSFYKMLSQNKNIENTDLTDFENELDCENNLDFEPLPFS